MRWFDINKVENKDKGRYNQGRAGHSGQNLSSRENFALTKWDKMGKVVWRIFSIPKILTNSLNFMLPATLL